MAAVVVVLVVVAVLTVASVGEGSSSITGWSCDGEKGVWSRSGDGPEAAGDTEPDDD